MRVVIDVDGVVAEFNHGLRTKLAKAAGRVNDVPMYEEPRQWSYFQDYGYSAAENAAAWTDIKSDPTFWATLKPLPGAFRFLDWLWRSVSVVNWTQGTSHEVYFLTDRSGLRAKDQTELWLKNHGFAGLPPTVIIARNGKGRIVRDLGATHIIDDKPENIAAVLAEAPTCRACLLDKAWNLSERERLASLGATLVPTLQAFQSILAEEI